jgi:hypothetical protein
MPHSDVVVHALNAAGHACRKSTGIEAPCGNQNFVAIDSDEKTPRFPQGAGLTY